MHMKVKLFHSKHGSYFIIYVVLHHFSFLKFPLIYRQYLTNHVSVILSNNLLERIDQQEIQRSHLHFLTIQF